MHSWQPTGLKKSKSPIRWADGRIPWMLPTLCEEIDRFMMTSPCVVIHIDIQSTFFLQDYFVFLSHLPNMKMLSNQPPVFFFFFFNFLAQITDFGPLLLCIITYECKVLLFKWLEVSFFSNENDFPIYPNILTRCSVFQPSSVSNLLLMLVSYRSFVGIINCFHFFFYKVCVMKTRFQLNTLLSMVNLY